MSFVAEQPNPEEPIVVFTYDGHLTREVFKDVIAMNAKYIRELGEIYIIADVRKLETTFVDMLKIMQEARQNNEGSAHDDSIKLLVFVGSSSFVKMYRDAMQKQGAAFGMSMYENMEDALEAVRMTILLNKDKKQSAD